jgi:protocatechuate 4,5-dioxygenase alpha subunit
MQANSIAFVGFGEAATSWVEGWGAGRAFEVSAYDIKTAHPSAAVRDAKWQDYRRWNVRGESDLATALRQARLVISLVTADQALLAAQACAPHLAKDSLYLDCNSCAPGTKRAAAQAVESAGARYVDVAVMAPVRPALHRVPLLISGPHVLEASHALRMLDMRVEKVTGGVGTVSSIKMVRSILVKGLEALTAECVLAARRAGVDVEVLQSLDESYPGFNWKERARYMLERAMTHGVRRAAEMREVARTVEELQLPPDMATATAHWQQRIGELKLRAPAGDAIGHYAARADAVSQALAQGAGATPRDEDYDDIPGTYVFDAEHSRLGYHLNMFCMSLNDAVNRDAFRAGEESYLDRFPMSPEQRASIRKREWNEMLRLGGNIYYTAKLAAYDGLTFQDLAGKMTGMSREDYRRMMVDGGRPIEGNRSKSEWHHG